MLITNLKEFNNEFYIFVTEPEWNLGIVTKKSNTNLF